MHPTLKVEVPDEALAEGLRAQLDEFDVDTVAVDGHWEVRINFKRNPESRVELALHAIGEWLLTVGIASLCVHLDGSPYMLHAPAHSRVPAA